MKAQIVAVRYQHPTHGVFVIQFAQDGSANCSRVYRSRVGTMRTETLPGTTRRDCRAAIKARVAELDRQLESNQPANHNAPEPLCSGEGKVSCA